MGVDASRPLTARPPAARLIANERLARSPAGAPSRYAQEYPRRHTLPDVCVCARARVWVRVRVCVRVCAGLNQMQIAFATVYQVAHVPLHAPLRVPLRVPLRAPFLRRGCLPMGACGAPVPPLANTSVRNRT